MTLPSVPPSTGLPGQRIPVHSGPVPLLAIPADPVMAGWLNECRRHLRTDDSVDIVHLGAMLDSWMQLWHRSAPQQRWDPSRTVSAAGVAMGDAIITATATVRWAIDPERRRAVLAGDDGIIVVRPLDEAERIWRSGIPGEYPVVVTAAAAALAPTTRAGAQPLPGDPADPSGRRPGTTGTLWTAGRSLRNRQLPSWTR